MKGIIATWVVVMTLFGTNELFAKSPKWAFSGWGKRGNICNMFFYYSSSSSTSSDSCDWVVPIMKNRKQELHRYVEVNRDRLIEDASQGGGAALTDYAHLMGCPADVIPIFAKASQAHFEMIFMASTSAADLVERSTVTLSQHPELVQNCVVPLS